MQKKNKIIFLVGKQEIEFERERKREVKKRKIKQMKRTCLHERFEIFTPNIWHTLNYFNYFFFVSFHHMFSIVLTGTAHINTSEEMNAGEQKCQRKSSRQIK